MDETRVWFKSSHGAPAITMSRDHLACAHVILSDSVFAVPDARAHPQFSHDPLVVGGPFACFYAGAPRRSAEGFSLGALCLMDVVPREFDREQQESLQKLAAVVVDTLAARLANRRLTMEIAVRERAEAALDQAQAGRTAMLAAAFDAIVGLDAAGCILELNPAAERLWDHLAVEVAGQDLVDLCIAPARRAAYRRDITPLLAGGESPLLGERVTLLAL